MRLHINTSGANRIVPFNYQPILTGAIHKWIGENEIHDLTSLYSFSWLMKGIAQSDGIRFDRQACFFISAFDNELIKLIINGIQENPKIGFGLEVKEITIQEDPDFSGSHLFYTASPILIKRNEEKRTTHFVWNDLKSDSLLTETLKRKLKQADINSDNLFVKFDRSYRNPKTKVVYYQNIGNRVNICPVIISGTSEQLNFAWNVGVGNSTGIGFGAIK